MIAWLAYLCGLCAAVALVIPQTWLSRRRRKRRSSPVVYANRQTVAGGPIFVHWNLTRRPAADLPRARMEARLRLGSWDDWVRESQGQ